MIGVSVDKLYKIIRGPTPPPFKKRGKRIFLPRVEFTEWAARDVIE